MPQYWCWLPPRRLRPVPKRRSRRAGEIHALNKEMIAAGVRKFRFGGLGPRSRCERRPMRKSSSPTGPYLETKEHTAVFGYWNALTWTRRWHGRAKASPPTGGRSRCENLFNPATD